MEVRAHDPKTRHLSTTAALALVVLLAVPFTFGCNDDRGPRSTGVALELNLELSPSPLLFESLAPGFEETRPIEISNAGESPVKVYGMRIEGPRDTFTADPMDDEIELEPGESASLEINYRQGSGLPAGTVFFETTHGTFSVPIRTIQGPPRITASPDAIDFGVLSLAEASADEIRLVNEGGSVGQVSDAFIVGAPDFILLDAGAQPPFSLQPGQAVRLRPAFRATTSGEHDATVVIGADSGTVEVGLLAQVRARPCIEVSPRELAFGDIVVGGSRTLTLEVSHCGLDIDEPLQLQQLVIRDANSTAFSIVERGADVLAGGESTDVLVEYAPGRLEFTDTATLRLVSDAENEPVIDVPLIGRGVERACEGRVIASCTVEGRDTPPSDELHVIPLDTISCEMTVEGTCPAVTTTWRLVEAPADSTSIPVTDGTDLSFFVDLAGDYLLEATAQFADGQSATPAQVHIEAVPDEELHVQLVWDNASDVDLHLLHPIECWEDGRFDCHFRNRMPDWGEAGPDDDPSLDIDDTNGFGPENINLNIPEPGVRYRVGVHYWSDHGQGAARATVRIFIRGELLFERSQILARSGDWWEVADVEWPASTVTPIDAVGPGTPSCP